MKDVRGMELNPRKIAARNLQGLVDSLLEFPSMMSSRMFVLNGEREVIGGNQRLKALALITAYTDRQIEARLMKRETFKRKDAEKRQAILSFWREWLKEPFVYADVRDDWDEDEQAEFVLKDNVSAGEFDLELMTATYDADLVTEWGIELPDLNDIVESVTGGTATEEPELDGGEDEPDEDDLDEDLVDEDTDSFFKDMLGDKLYDSDNDYDIPTLRLDRQPVSGVELPLAAWGSQSRRLRSNVGTYHFYVDDYRFEALWKDPINVLRSGCKAIVEPNLSCYDTTPIAYGLSLIYKKRYLARYYQECGIQVYVDLNVATKFADFNKLGVPKGYNAFATRGYSQWLGTLENELKVAQEISGLERPNLIVYGGGADVKKFCQQHGITYLEQFINDVNHQQMKCNLKGK